MEAAPRTRPTGVTILAVLAAIGGVLGLLAGVAALGLSGAVGAGGGGALAGMVGIIGIIAVAQGALALAFAYGAWTLKPWGWTLGVVAEAIGIGLAVLFIINGDSISNQAISIVIAGAILYYLFRPHVKAAFGRA